MEHGGKMCLNEKALEISLFGMDVSDLIPSHKLNLPT